MISIITSGYIVLSPVYMYQPGFGLESGLKALCIRGFIVNGSIGLMNAVRLHQTLSKVQLRTYS